MKAKLSLLPINRGAFSCAPAREVELEDEKVLCNNIVFPSEFNPHNVRLFVIGNEFGALCAVWASHEQEAFDEACDADFLDSHLISPEDFAKMTEEEKADCLTCGNASEPFDQTYLWIQQVRFDRVLDFDLFMQFAEARGDASKTLYR